MIKKRRRRRGVGRLVILYIDLNYLYDINLKGQSIKLIVDLPMYDNDYEMFLEVFKILSSFWDIYLEVCVP